MKFLMIHAVDPEATAEDPSSVSAEALDAWIDEMLARGVLLDGSRLHPSSDATTVRGVGGSPVVTDGPFAETKEQVAGYDVIDCPDLDSALAVAAAHPTTHLGAIEVRAFGPQMPDPVVPEQVPDGKLRYLMLVCADMRRAMLAAREAAAQGQEADTEQQDEDGDDQIDTWIRDAGPRRLYGWQLELPDQAVTVRRVDGAVVTTDGPFAETKEQIAGYDLLECDDLDDALEVASAHPVVDGGVIELRPLRG
jgi:hypothetical protein